MYKNKDFAAIFLKKSLKNGKFSMENLKTLLLDDKKIF
jgi:hypothetical protein